MSAQPVPRIHVPGPRALPSRSKHDKANGKANGKAKKLAIKEQPLHAQRKPNAKTDAALCHAAAEGRKDGFGLVELVEQFRVRVMQLELKAADGVKTLAAARLGITRTHLDNYLARGKELL